MRLAVLISGRGSNLRAIHAAIEAAELEAEIVLVVANQPGAAGLEWARDHAIPARLVPSKGVPRPEYDAQLIAVLREAQPDLVCLAGFMRLLTPSFIQAFEGRILNIHPSLLPSFKGLHAAQQALDYGVKIAGCTVHLVTNEMDAGPILLQAAVPVLEGDTDESLSNRILEQEHRLYPAAIRLMIDRPARHVE